MKHNADLQLTRLRSGDSGALAELMAEHGDRLLRAAFCICRDAVQAQDLVQETFCRVIPALPSYRGDALLYTWLYRVMRNIYYNQMRRQREILMLRFVEEMKLAEIAETLGLAPGTVKSRLHNALKVCGEKCRSRRCSEPAWRWIMRCEKVRGCLEEWLDGELPANAGAELERHLQGCAACAHALEQRRRLGRDLKRTLREQTAGLRFQVPETFRLAAATRTPEPLFRNRIWRTCSWRYYFFSGPGPRRAMRTGPGCS